MEKPDVSYSLPLCQIIAFTGGRGGLHGQSVKEQDRRCLCFCPRLVGNYEGEVNCERGLPYMMSKEKGEGGSRNISNLWKISVHFC